MSFNARLCQELAHPPAVAKSSQNRFLSLMPGHTAHLTLAPSPFSSVPNNLPRSPPSAKTSFSVLPTIPLRARLISSLSLAFCNACTPADIVGDVSNDEVGRICEVYRSAVVGRRFGERAWER